MHLRSEIVLAFCSILTWALSPGSGPHRGLSALKGVKLVTSARQST